MSENDLHGVDGTLLGYHFNTERDDNDIEFLMPTRLVTVLGYDGEEVYRCTRRHGSTVEDEHVLATRSYLESLDRRDWREWMGQ